MHVRGHVQPGLKWLHNHFIITLVCLFVCLFVSTNGFCLLVPGLSSTSGLAFALQANDPHTREFTLAILRLQRTHVLEDLYRKWWQTSNSCVDEENTRKNNFMGSGRISRFICEKEMR